ncbi:metalloprotease, partial [Coemansia sp. RSA 2706]
AWHFGEVQRTLQLEFYHGERAAPVAAAIALACQLGCPHLRAEHAVSGTRLLYKFDAPGIEALLTLLEPENYRLYLGAREFDDADALPCVDPHLGVAYGETPLPRRLTSEAELAAAPLEHANRLQFPQPNPYIPANVPTCTLQAPAPDNAGNNANDTDDVFQAPVLVRHDPLCELWLRTLPSTGGAMARSSITVGIAPSCVHATARGQALLGLAAWALEHAAAAHLGLARAAGIAWHVWVADHTLCVRVRGHAHLPDILEQTLATLSALDIGDREFAQLQGRALRAAECMRTASPRELVGWQQHCMRAEPRWHFAHCAQELARVGAADLRAFVRDAFARVHVRVLVVGAGAADDARAVGARVVRALDACAPVPRVLRTRMRAVDVAPGVYVLRVRSGQAGGDCAVSYTVSAPRAASRWAQAQFTLLAHMMGAAFFDRLRTQEQLGYMVGCSWVGDASIGAGGLELRVQGTSNPEFVCLRIERFLLEFGRRLEAMGEPELAGHRDALATANLDSPRTAARATAYLWPKILAGSYDFSCVFEVNRQLAALRKADVLEFWRAHVCPLDAQKKSTRVVVQAWADALHMPSDNVLREHPLPVVALHLCLQAAGAHELALSDVSCFVSERTLDEPRIAMAELQRRLAALYRALAPECSDRVCADIAAGHAQLGAALQMALDASRYPGSLLTSQPTPSDTAAPRNAPRTFAGAWIVADYLAFKRMHALHAPCSPAIPLEPLDGCGL